MNKRMKQLAAAGITAAVTLGGVFLSWPALAANYTPVSGSSATNPTFQKYMIMRAGDTTPQATFKYTVSKGNARSTNTSDNSVMEVREGVSAEKIKVTDAVFTAGQTTSSTAAATQIDVQRTDRNAIGLDTDKGEKFAVSSCTVDFSSVSFPEPGIYRYKITETASASDEAKGILHDSDTDRIMDVYVTDNSGALKVSAYVLHMEDSDVAIGTGMGSNDVSENGKPLQDKTDGFTSEYKSDDLVFTQSVNGNQASKDKYFAMTVELGNLTPGDQYVVSLADDGNANTSDGKADAQISANPNAATTVITSAVTQPALLTAGSEGTVSQTFYLQDGQSVALRGIPANGTYTVNENAEDYKATGAAVSGYTDAVSSGKKGISAIDKNHDQVIKTSYMNQRAGIVPTGVLASVLPGTLILCGGSLGIIILVARSHRRKEENE